ncbi:phage capsid protein [Gordonia westfalica]|uniref:p22 coat protein-gene protein 5 n=2 Tax=Gordonia westfalica TaxID=158898 RepID=A0A1H2DQ36_9ACTN|nr:P22 phage major capsid protein family protein [Gordonia westfalica]SDT85000.1 P22 coat protein-gene protein 5 [Gordonia westfalica]SDT85003.1 P22 coat protein-gene protein 5 [Gordonia westfalica]SDT85089.1 P22 coat protein-gene protein 5 [Gordonia westfalica]SDT85182.1 P22 coat protein-gene protein 5 [Gordonia westfalica]SDT86128.1 P22 coat protein-gene protein 5 [Gordonia westfalica]
MAITHFIPELWAANITQAWDAEKVFAALLDRQYEGVATKGNTVHIPGVVAPAIKDYKANNRTTSADAITDTGVDLLIDQEKNFDFKVDDIDAAQSAGSLAPYTDAAGKALVDDADKFIATMLAAGATNLSGSAPDTGNKAFDLVKAARVALNKKNAPASGRVLVCNADFEGLLLGADSKLTSFDVSGDNNGLRNGTIGSLLGFRVLSSNNLPNNSTPGFVAFHPEAAAYVSQLDKVEALRADNSFADRLRGLHVYGGKVVRPDGVVKFGMTSGS